MKRTGTAHGCQRLKANGEGDLRKRSVQHQGESVMLVQLNRNIDARDFSATATGLPLNPANLPATSGPRPVVAVLGPAARVAGLAPHLPAGWSVRAAGDLDDVHPDE